MPVYTFKCKECEFTDDYVYSMKDVPSEIECPECETGIMKQDFQANQSTTSTIIPSHMKAGNHNPIKYGKASKKRIW